MARVVREIKYSLKEFSNSISLRNSYSTLILPKRITAAFVQLALQCKVNPVDKFAYFQPNTSMK